MRNTFFPLLLFFALPIFTGQAWSVCLRVSKVVNILPFVFAGGQEEIWPRAARGPRKTLEKRLERKSVFLSAQYHRRETEVLI